MHGKLMDGPSDARKVDSSSWNVPQTYGKLTDSPFHARKVDGSSWNVLRTYEKLMEGPMDKWKADGRSLGCPAKLTVVHGMSRGHTES